MPEQKYINVPCDFLQWRGGANGLAATRLLEERVYCLSSGPDQISLTIETATGEQARVVLSCEAAFHLSHLLICSAEKRWPEPKEGAGNEVFFTCIHCGVRVAGYDVEPPPSWVKLATNPDRYICQDCAENWDR